MVAQMQTSSPCHESSLDNPRRRQRNMSEECIAHRQPLKRRKRVGLQQETTNGSPQPSPPVNGDSSNKENELYINGARSTSNGSIAIRPRQRNLSAAYGKNTVARPVGTELTRNEVYTITQAPGTPAVLLDDYKADPWRAEIFPSLGHALVMTKTEAIAWKYTPSAAPDQPQAYRIPLLHPASGDTYDPLAFGMLLSTAAEPSVLIVTARLGKITYWESVSLAASPNADRQRQQALQTELVGIMSGEEIVRVVEAEPRGFVLAFNSGRMAHLLVSDLRGRPQIKVFFMQHSAAQTGGLLGSLKGVLNLGGWKHGAPNVKAGHSARRGQRFVIARTAASAFQIWDLSWNGTQTLHRAFDVDMNDVMKTEKYQILDFVPSETSLLLLVAAEKFSLVRVSLEGVVQAAIPTTSPAESTASLLLPEPSPYAFIVCPRSIVLVSLEDYSPSAQLQLEAEMVLEDTIRFHRPILAAVAETARCACSFMFAGFGVVQVLAKSPMKLQNKLEQAVFYDSFLLDFTPCSEEDHERVALEISHSIVSSTSPYLASVSASMGDNLTRRAAALSKLARHLRQHYPPISVHGRWQLLWDAEKMEAAKILWQQYDIGGPEKKDLFAQMIETIVPEYKLENQPDSGETDGVRHWLVHDVWRLEWAIPYSHEIIELLFKESVEDEREYGLLTKANMIETTVDIQLGVLSSAYQFRQQHAAEYGLDEDDMTEGVLEDFGDLPEFWSCSAAVTSRVRETVDVAREMAKLLASSLEEHFDSDAKTDDDFDAEAYHTTMMRLARANPRQVQVCCQGFLERSRWLSSQSDRQKEAQLFMNAQEQVRRQQFVDLVDLEMTAEAIELAEKYADMTALLQIFEREGDNPDFAPTIAARVDQYFLQFGILWANAYFTRYLSEGPEAARVLGPSARHKHHLTRFLRDHPTHAKLAWINEVTAEDDFARAGKSLQQAAAQETDIWNQKVMFSLAKLSLLAVPRLHSTPSSGVVDRDLAVLAIQEKLGKTIHQNTIDALDQTARLDLAVERYRRPLKMKTPFLDIQLRSHLQTLLEDVPLAMADLIELLSLVRADTEPAIPAAFQVLFHSADTSTAKTLWRRVFISTDWDVLNRTEMKGDVSVTAEFRVTALYQTLLAGYRVGSDGSRLWDRVPIYSPEEVRGSIATENKELSHDLRQEDAVLAKHISHARLPHWFRALQLDARAEAVKDRPRER